MSYNLRKCAKFFEVHRDGAVILMVTFDFDKFSREVHTKNYMYDDRKFNEPLPNGIVKHSQI